ncbi:hypothetical protein M8C21_024823 [Ambrosia artemisiifolia]|uniref:Uncharacterized protein n=1 Tax=Ambrosia artemisiifolia TaxID=4212 RepID=A0AAD5D6M7_AMBAR|nr:hypothetical protein M8C21_024823 [Ambrosia artemisiifolia]
MDATSSGPTTKRAKKGAARATQEEPVIIEEEDPTRISGAGLLEFEFLGEARQRYDEMRQTPLHVARTID